MSTLSRKRVYTEEQKEARRVKERARYWSLAGIKGQHAARTKRYRQKLKADLITGYGGKCACCEEDEPCFLTIDHPDGDGKAHRAQFRNALGVYRDLRDRGYPPPYRLLCFNCNIATSLFGVCPHHQRKA